MLREGELQLAALHHRAVLAELFENFGRQIAPLQQGQSEVLVESGIGDGGFQQLDGGAGEGLLDR